MKATIFYSWQSDLPNATNRGFIGQALADAIKVLQVDGTVEVEPVLDRDTEGQSGSPNIADTIFRKIDEAAVFVADVSIIGSAGDNQRSTPNPNVLVELGYAFKTLGHERVIMVVNTAFGAVEELPFDLRMRRTLSYHMTVESPRGDERRRLQDNLEVALRGTLAAARPPAVTERTPLQLAADAVERQAPNQVSVDRRGMTWLAERIADLSPEFESQPQSEWDDLLVSAIDASTDLTADFGLLTQIVADMNAGESARAVHEEFSRVLEQYNTPRGFSRPHYEIEFDLAKFLGHELFVMLFSHLIREGRWELIGDLLDRGIFLSNPSDGRPRAVPFTKVSEYVRLLDHRNNRLNLRRASLHAEILKQRHTEGGIGSTTPMHEFTAADFFLYLRGAATASPADHGFDWRPWSVLYFREEPSFLHNIELRREAEQLLRPLGVASIDTLRELFRNRAPKVREMFSRHAVPWDYPLARLDTNAIGSR